MTTSLVFQANKAQQWVNQNLDRPIQRTAFYQWRKFLNMIDTPYTLEDLNAIAYFGQCVQMGATLEQAKVQTIKYLRGHHHV